MRNESLYIVHAQVRDSESGVIHEGPIVAMLDRAAAVALGKRLTGFWYSTKYYKDDATQAWANVGRVIEPMDFGWRRWGTFTPAFNGYEAEHEFRMRFWHRSVYMRISEVPWLYEPSQVDHLDIKFEGRELQLTWI